MVAHSEASLDVSNAEVMREVQALRGDVATLLSIIGGAIDAVGEATQNPMVRAMANNMGIKLPEKV